jgi:predicted ester cyclase
MAPETRTLEQNLDQLKSLGRFPGKQDLHGFEPRFENIVDYIVKITYHIWEQVDMGYIYDTYLHNLEVHTGYGTSYGVEEVINGSIAFLAAMPDRRMYAEDVIWSGDNETGFHTSHLILNTATNTGYSPWGPPTGKKVQFIAIANCLVKENRIIEEWLVRDTMAIVSQLGFNPWEIARKTLAGKAKTDVIGETDRLHGQLPPQPYEPRADLSDIENFIRKLFHDIWNGRHFSLLAETYTETASLHIPNHRELKTLADIVAYHLGFIAQFPDAAMTVEHVYYLGNDVEGYRIALRWRFSGTHQRNGWYGEPTGKRVNILGVSQLHVQHHKISKHYFMFDELAVLMQLVGEC